jgi:hypothetical protein
MGIFYKWFMNSKVQTLTEEIEEMIEAIEECNLISDERKVIDTDGALIDKSDIKYVVFKDVVDDKTFYNVFYQNIHIRIEDSQKESVYSVHLKKQEDSWVFNLDKRGKGNFTHPKTETFRVFVSYDIPVLNITRAAGVSYSHGSWDRYVYQNLNDLFDSISECTEVSKFNKSYNEM